jgi:hypothetical protein
MPTPAPPAGRDPDGPSAAGIAAATGAVALIVLCCAGPALLTAGTLAGIGAWLANPWMIAAALVALAAITVVAARRRRSARDACCPPTTPADRDQVPGPASSESRDRR